MSQNDGGDITITLGETVTKNTLIKLISGVGWLTTGVASEDNKLVGVAQEGGDAGDKIRVRHIGTNASLMVKVAGAVSIGAYVYTAASGLGTATVTSLTNVGVAMLASTASGDIIEVMRVAGADDDIT